MTPYRCVIFCVLVAAVFGGMLVVPAMSQSPAGPGYDPAMQQPMPYPSTNAPAAYPPNNPYAAVNPYSAASPYPSTPYPSTGATAASPYALIASADPSMPYPSTQPSPYPTTATPTAEPILTPNPSMPQYGAADTMSMPQPPADPGPLYAPYSSSDAAMSGYSLDANDYVERAMADSDECWMWQILPGGLVYKTYMASDREPRVESQIVHDRNQGWLWDSTVGARVGLLRYGTVNEFWPQGWQLDVEGAAFPRVSLEDDRNLVACDFRVGMPLTYRQGRYEMKFGYSHYCSHIGDEYLIQHPTFTRRNYVRESLILGMGIYANPSLRLYWETNWAFYTDGESRPWHFQFGVDYCTNEPTGAAGAPFFAVNGQLREENDFSGNFTVQSGWLWRGCSGRTLRFGMQYFNGFSDQAQFYNTFEELIGAGLWYDF